MKPDFLARGSGVRISRQARQRIFHALTEVVDRLDGYHSGIPECCVEAYVRGSRSITFFRDKPDDWRRRAYQYVPCLACWEAGRVSPLLLNGHSWLAARLLDVRDQIEDGQDGPLYEE